MTYGPATAKFAVLAEHIAQGMPPTELAKVLADVAGGIASTARAETEAPTSTQLRDRLEQVERAARLLAAALCEPNIVGRLDNAGQEIVHTACGRIDWLQALSSRAHEAVTKVKVENGKKPWANPNGLSATTICAVIVSRLWMEVRGKAPGLQQKAAWAACDMLWQGAGQPPIGSDLEAWRYHLTKAKAVLEGSQEDDPGGTQRAVLRLLNFLVEPLKQRKATPRN